MNYSINYLTKESFNSIENSYCIDLVVFFFFILFIPWYPWMEFEVARKYPTLNGKSGGRIIIGLKYMPLLGSLNTVVAAALR